VLPQINNLRALVDVVLNVDGNEAKSCASQQLIPFNFALNTLGVI
jgi:hypothetical protein